MLTQRNRISNKLARSTWKVASRKKIQTSNQKSDLKRKEPRRKVATLTNPVSPSPAGVQANITFWLLNGLSPSDGKSVAIVIKSFNFTPAT